MPESEAGYAAHRAVTDPDGKALLVPDGKEAAILVRLRDGAVLRRLTDLAMDGSAMAVARNLRHIALDRSFAVVDLYRLSEDGLAERVLSGNHKSTLHSIAFRPDGRGLIAGGHGDLIYRDIDPWSSTELGGHLSQTIWAVAVSPDSKTAASVSKQVVKLWNLETRREVVSLDWPEHDGWPILDFEPTGRFLVAMAWSDEGLAVRVWEAPSFEEIAGDAPVRVVEESTP